MLSPAMMNDHAYIWDGQCRRGLFANANSVVLVAALCALAAKIGVGFLGSFVQGLCIQGPRPCAFTTAGCPTIVEWWWRYRR